MRPDRLLPPVAAAVSVLLASGNVADGSVTLKGRDGTVEIVLPNGWQSIPVPAASTAAVQLMGLNKGADTGVLVGIEDRADVNWTLDQYAARAMERLRVSPRFTEQSQTAFTPVQVHDHDALRCEFRCTVDGVRLAYLQTYIQTDRSFLTVSTWAVQSRFDRLKAGLGRLAAGVRETPPSP